MGPLRLAHPTGLKSPEETITFYSCRINKQGQHLIIGGPGTGKSVLALLRARRHHQDKDDYVFLVFNRLLNQASRQLFGNGLNSEQWQSWFMSAFTKLTGNPTPMLPPGKNRWQPIDWAGVAQVIATAQLFVEKFPNWENLFCGDRQFQGARAEQKRQAARDFRRGRAGLISRTERGLNAPVRLDLSTATPSKGWPQTLVKIQRAQVVTFKRAPTGPGHDASSTCWICMNCHSGGQHIF
jgi:hypothetical protein